MNKVPTIFLSSVTKSLEKHRERVYSVINDEFGWNCYPFGIRNEPYGGSPISTCLSLVDDADLYIGLFWRRAGDKDDLENIYITEMEFYHAVNARKLIRIYVIEANPSTVDRDLYLFLKTIKEDPREGQCIRSCESVDDLINKLRNDLEYFDDCRSKGETPHWTSYCLLEEALKKRGLLKPRLERYQLHVTEQINRDFLQQKIKKMQEHFNRSEFPEAADIGANLLHGFLSLRISPENKELLPLWAIFLRMWSGSCTWLGLIDGTFGSLWAAKMQRRTYQILGWWGAMYGSANLISNAYYVRARLSENKKYSSDITPEYREKLEAERIKFLKKALDYDEIYRTRVMTPEPKLYSSHIYQALGDYDRAASGFERLLRYRVDTSNDIGYLGTLADLGVAKISKANASRFPQLRKEGMIDLQKAHDRVQQYSSTPWYISIEKEFVKGLLLIGEKKYAQQLLTELHRIALKQRLFNQADSIRALSVKAA